MQTTASIHEISGFSRQIVGTLKAGIRKNERFENLSTEILNNIANQLLLVDDLNVRKVTLSNYYLELEKAQKIRKFHMIYETPTNNKQLSAALMHLKGQFKLRFSKYFS
jgi:hypothetical protein